jgi:hypothetical protein
MIDLIVVVQAVVAGLILYRSAHETQAWDRAGFALLACAAGLMTIRRVTASLDRYASMDRVVLPHIITWAMLAAATCFALELLSRTISKRQDRNGNPMRVASAKFVWPFALMFLMSASEFVPVAQQWTGEHIRDLTAEEATREVLSGTNPAAACEAVRRHSARGIDVLRIKAGSDEEGSKDALQKLRSLALRVNSAIQAHEDALKAKVMK